MLTERLLQVACLAYVAADTERIAELATTDGFKQLNHVRSTLCVRTSAL